MCNTYRYRHKGCQPCWFVFLFLFRFRGFLIFSEKITRRLQIVCVPILPVLLCPVLSPLPSKHLSVNHASQIAPWLQSTLKWWKWIKLITDSHCESWQDIKSCRRCAVVHSSAVFYDGGESDSVPITFSALSSINPDLYYVLCTLSFYTLSQFCPSSRRVVGCWWAGAANCVFFSVSTWWNWGFSENKIQQTEYMSMVT